MLITSSDRKRSENDSRSDSAECSCIISSRRNSVRDMSKRTGPSPPLPLPSPCCCCCCRMDPNSRSRASWAAPWTRTAASRIALMRAGPKSSGLSREPEPLRSSRKSSRIHISTPGQGASPRATIAGVVSAASRRSSAPLRRRSWRRASWTTASVRGASRWSSAPDGREASGAHSRSIRVRRTSRRAPRESSICVLSTTRRRWTSWEGATGRGSLGLRLRRRLIIATREYAVARASSVAPREPTSAVWESRKARIAFATTASSFVRPTNRALPCFLLFTSFSPSPESLNDVLASTMLGRCRMNRPGFTSHVPVTREPPLPALGTNTAVFFAFSSSSTVPRSAPSALRSIHTVPAKNSSEPGSGVDRKALGSTTKPPFGLAGTAEATEEL
mmetsp:Transcript_15490/g.38189  ORF Transcript_15490/g.38189 Transcript_15490/m.38189 type:complete len:389 (-) Transcript_15490:1760-2926(-)